MCVHTLIMPIALYNKEAFEQEREGGEVGKERKKAKGGGELRKEDFPPSFLSSLFLVQVHSY